MPDIYLQSKRQGHTDLHTLTTMIGSIPVTFITPSLQIKVNKEEEKTEQQMRGGEQKETKFYISPSAPTKTVVHFLML